MDRLEQNRVGEGSDGPAVGGSSDGSEAFESDESVAEPLVVDGDEGAQSLSAQRRVGQAQLLDDAVFE